MTQIEEAIKSYGKRIDELLRKIIPPDRQDFLCEPIWHHLNTGGKRIRPAVCLITCEALGGNPENALHFASAVEILHNMFLLHDDIEDGDTMRRDKPTVWVKYGIDNAINAGDYMVARGYQSILASPVSTAKKLKLIEVFTLTYEKTVEGQALDINLRAAKDITVEDYLKMVRLKTGCYLACGMVGGAIIADIPDNVVDKIWELGKSMGPAFQIRDDLIDLTLGKGRGGVIGSDIKEGKASFLYAYTLGVANVEEKNTLIQIMAKPRESTTGDDIKWVLNLYNKYNVKEYAQNFAEDLIKEAYKTIEKFPVDNKEIFREIANFMAQRTA